MRTQWPMVLTYMHSWMYQVHSSIKAANMFFLCSMQLFYAKGRCNNVIDHVSIEPISAESSTAMANSVSPMVQS